MLVTVQGVSESDTFLFSRGLQRAPNVRRSVLLGSHVVQAGERCDRIMDYRGVYQNLYPHLIPDN